MSKDDTLDVTSGFQPIAGEISWNVHFKSSPERVFEFLTQANYRALYWAESAQEQDGVIHYKFLNGVESRGKILEVKKNKRFVVEYFDLAVTFELNDCPGNECDMRMTCANVAEEEKTELIAGWVSWLLSMKAAADHGVDLRNHDEQRTWYHGFADN